MTTHTTDTIGESAQEIRERIEARGDTVITIEPSLNACGTQAMFKKDDGTSVPLWRVTYKTKRKESEMYGPKKTWADVDREAKRRGI